MGTVRQYMYNLPKTNSSPLKIGGKGRPSFPFVFWPMFRAFRVGFGDGMNLDHSLSCYSLNGYQSSMKTRALVSSSDIISMQTRG